ncbi:LysM peptidoglycan-binding domain-containing protein [Paenibacillus sp.]|uniref:LysM peptidoglycan-binding domain-containing protein n=1 Tax=Paenibacillus sp. TaxID=58172 RepID=UPI002D491A5B|nr:LysM peptidoglycan-binding domain-containing protein [Paenibacillus sp.]HZG56064.1 LysM peptidoglycan-binding domain-containing protein [Paenibacillus sp.]
MTMRRTTYKQNRTNAGKVFLARILLFLALVGIGATSGVMIHAHAMNPGEASLELEAAALDNPGDAIGERPASPAAVLCVEPGDTLWAIAKKYGPEDVPTKKYVQQILEANELDSAALSVGQVLVLP